MASITDRDELKRRLQQKSTEARKRTDELLAEELQALANATTTDLDGLRPRVSDPAAYAKLLAAVEESTRQNENIAQLRERLGKAGQAVLAMAKEAGGLLRDR